MYKFTVKNKYVYIQYIKLKKNIFVLSVELLCHLSILIKNKRRCAMLAIKAIFKILDLILAAYKALQQATHTARQYALIGLHIGIIEKISTNGTYYVRYRGGIWTAMRWGDGKRSIGKGDFVRVLCVTQGFILLFDDKVDLAPNRD